MKSVPTSLFSCSWKSREGAGDVAKLAQNLCVYMKPWAGPPAYINLVFWPMPVVPALGSWEVKTVRSRSRSSSNTQQVRGQLGLPKFLSNKERQRGGREREEGAFNKDYLRLSKIAFSPLKRKFIN